MEPSTLTLDATSLPLPSPSERSRGLSVEKSGVYSVPRTPTGVLNSGQELHLGDHIKQYVNAPHYKFGGGYVGCVNDDFESHGIITSLFPDHKMHEKFMIQIFQVLSSDESVNTRFHSGEIIPVLYGMPLLLVDQNKRTWNNKTGGLTGYIGPRLPKSRGEMFVSFDAVGKSGKSVCVGDTVEIDIEGSNRKSNFYDHRLRQFMPKKSSLLGFFKKKEASENQQGGKSPQLGQCSAYVVCDGKGVSASFVLHMSAQHAPGCAHGDACDVHVCGRPVIEAELPVMTTPVTPLNTAGSSGDDVAVTSPKRALRIQNTNDLVNMMKNDAVTIDTRSNMSKYGDEVLLEHCNDQVSEKRQGGGDRTRLLMSASSDKIEYSTSSSNVPSNENLRSFDAVSLNTGMRSRTLTRSRSTSKSVSSMCTVISSRPSSTTSSMSIVIADASFSVMDVIAVSCLFFLLLSLSTSLHNHLSPFFVFLSVVVLFGCYVSERLRCNSQSGVKTESLQSAVSPAQVLTPAYNPIDLRSHPNMLPQVTTPRRSETRIVEDVRSSPNSIAEQQGALESLLEGAGKIDENTQNDNENRQDSEPDDVPSTTLPLMDSEVAELQVVPSSLSSFKQGISKYLDLSPIQAYQLLGDKFYHFRNPSYSTLPVPLTPEGYNAPVLQSNGLANPLHRVPKESDIIDLREQHLGKWDHMLDLSYDQVKKNRDFSSFLADEYIDMPDRMIEAEAGNVELGQQRWFDILVWRRQNKMNSLLIAPYAEFEYVRKLCGHYFHGHDKFGHMIYVERPGMMQLKELKAAGFDEPRLQTHFLHNCEYQWNVLDGSANAKVLSILDMQGQGFMDMMGGANMGFAKKVSKLLQAYYPVRGFKIVIVNAPSWFNGMWKVISPLLHERTRAKTIVCNSDVNTIKTTLQQFVDPENLPRDYGGDCACDEGNCTNHPMERNYKTFMKYVNGSMKLV